MSVLSIAVIIIVWLMTSTLNGEVFIVSNDGKVVVVPGPNVVLYRVTAPQEEAISMDMSQKSREYSVQLILRQK